MFIVNRPAFNNLIFLRMMNWLLMLLFSKWGAASFDGTLKQSPPFFLRANIILDVSPLIVVYRFMQLISEVVDLIQIG